MQETWVQPLAQEDPICHGATKPMCHSYEASALEPVCHSKRNHHDGDPMNHNGEQPLLATTTQKPVQHWRPSIVKNKQLIKNLRVCVCMCGGFPGASDGKESTCTAGDKGLIPGLGRPPWRRKWQPTPIFLPRKSLGWRNLGGYSPWSQKAINQPETSALGYYVLSY